MSDLFAVGTNKSEPFCVTLNATEVTQLITSLLITHSLAKMKPLQLN